MTTASTGTNARRPAGHRRQPGPAPQRTDPGSWWQQRTPPRWLGRGALTVTLVVVGVMIALDLLGKLRGLLILLLISFFIGCAMEPFVNWLVRRGWRRTRATGLAFLLVLLAGTAFSALMGQLIVRQVRDLVEALPGFARDAADLLDERFDTNLSGSEVTAQLTGPNSPLESLGRQLAGNVVGLGASVLGLLFQTLSVALFTYYFAVDGPRLRRWLCTFLPPDRQREFLRLADIAVDRTAAFFYYRTALAVLSAAVHTAAFVALDLPNPIALGLWVGVVSQFIPTVGTYIAGFLPLLVSLTEGWRTAVAVLAFIVIYQQVENYLVSPRLSRRTMNIHPAVGFGSVIAGAAILGPVGAVLALPMTAIVQSFAGTYVHRHELVHEAREEPLGAERGDAVPAGPG
jgi:predicted PurR-regulated permease PerM